MRSGLIGVENPSILESPGAVLNPTRERESTSSQKYDRRLGTPVAGAYRRQDLTLLFILASIWGTAFTFITIGLDRFAPFQFAALRFDITGIVLLAVAAFRRKGPLLPQGRTQWGIVLTAGFLMTCLYHAFLFWGQQFTASGIAAIIVGLSPVLTIVFTHALLHDERVGWRGILGVGLGFLGIVLLGTLKKGGFDEAWYGELAIVAAIAAWALGSVLVKRSKHGMDVFSFAAWQALVGAVLLHIVSLFLEGTPTVFWDAWGVGSLLYLAIVSSAVGFIMYFHLVETVGPLRVNVVSYIAPVFANVAGLLILKESIQFRGIVAFALIATSLTLVIRSPRRVAQGPPTSKPEDLRGV